MLYQDLSGRNRDLGFLIRKQGGRHLGAVDPCVDVPGPGNLQFVEAFDRSDAADDFLRDFPRCLAQFLRQLEGKRHGVLAQLHLRRLFDHDFDEVEIVGTAQEIPQSLDQTAFERAIQGASLNC